jgi:hypothetical protein
MFGIRSLDCGFGSFRCILSVELLFESFGRGGV